MVAALRTIHHLKEDIAFYLTDLVEQLRPDQIFAVLTQEFLDEDAEAALGLRTTDRIHHNAPDVPEARRHLCPLAHTNLRRFLAPDYAAIRRLHTLKPIAPQRLKVLLA